MTNKKVFWQIQMAGLLVLYAVAAVMALQGHAGHRFVLLIAIIPLVHVLELPVAFVMLKGKNANPLRVIAATLLFGLLWWLPARRGLFAVR